MAGRLIYLDECVDARLASLLTQRGHPATTAATERMLAASDLAHLELAAGRSRPLITHNRRDFQRLHREWQAQGRTHAGIIILRQETVSRLELRAAMLLDWLAPTALATGNVYVWHDLQQLLDRGFRQQGYTEAEVRFVSGRRA